MSSYVISRTARSGFEESASPHIRGSVRLHHVYGGRALALLPVFAAAAFLHGAPVAAHVAAATAASFLSDGLAFLLLRRPSGWRSVYPLYGGLLLGLVLPPALPVAAVLPLALIVFFLFRDAAGRTGSTPLQTAALAALLIQVFRPGAIPEPAPASFGALLVGAHEGLPGATPSLFLLVPGILLVFSRLVRWETPLIFLAAYLLPVRLSGGDAVAGLFGQASIMAAFFLITEPGTVPVTRRAMAWGAAAGGAAAFCFERFTPLTEGAFAAVLFLNLLTPWLDRGIRPANLPQSGQ